MDADGALTKALSCGRRSRVVLTPRRWRQVLEKQASCKLLGGDGGKQARSPGRARNKLLKPLRAGMPGDPGATVVTNACVLLPYTRGCGCNGHPAFPTPSLGGSFMHNSGASRRGKAEVCLAVIASAAKRRSNPLLLSCCGMDCVASLAMTVYFSSSTAKAGDPVFRDGNDHTEKLRRTGYSAGACHRARRRRDPVAEYDGFI